MAIVSDSHKFIYVSGGRCATTSINTRLVSIPGIDFYDPAQADPALWKSYNKHLPAKKIRELIGKEKWNRYFKFTFVRNTYSWVASSFLYMAERKIFNMPPDRIMTMQSFQEVADYFETPVGRRHDDSWPIRSQKCFISDENYNVIVDYVGRFEFLQNDFSIICDKIGVAHMELPITNNSLSSAVDWRVNYQKNPGAEKFVYDKWKMDIDYFGFKL